MRSRQLLPVHNNAREGEGKGNEDDVWQGGAPVGGQTNKGKE